MIEKIDVKENKIYELDPIILNFYKRRIKRILPTWFPVLFGMHILNLYFGNDCPHSFFEALLYYTGIGWWIHIDLPPLSLILSIILFFIL